MRRDKPLHGSSPASKLTTLLRSGNAIMPFESLQSMMETTNEIAYQSKKSVRQMHLPVASEAVSFRDGPDVSQPVLEGT
jgi:hypothetical protein